MGWRDHVADLLGTRSFHSIIWAGVLASPFIGLLMAGLAQPLFEHSLGFRRRLIALASLYLSASLFGLTLGAYDWVSGNQTSRSLTEVVFP